MKLLLIAALLFLIFPEDIHASQVQVETVNTYKIEESGNVHVLHEIAITNLTSEVYPSDFVLNLEGVKPVNIYASENSIPVKVSVIEKGSTYSLVATFTKMTLGKDERKEFEIQYDLDRLANKNGDVWEIEIPKLLEDNVFSTYKTLVSVPKSFGEEAFINPQPQIFESVGDNNLYHFDKDQLIHSPITGAFGNFQSYNVNLVYHLENPLNQVTVAEIALPPDTDYQRISIESFNPYPKDFQLDQDGNWIASVELDPRVRVDVNVVMRIDIFPISRNIDKPTNAYLDSLLMQNQYWDPTYLSTVIKDLDTPENIYEYVLSTLKYDYEKVGTLVKRNGIKSISTPNSATCTDFSDLTITLLRKAGIPAREVQGYAYSVNANAQPISLVEDVLHSWVEYWDNQRQMWIQIDPTWGQTSGEDYLNSFDLNHISFVRHGIDPLKPYPAGSYNYGSMPQKDVLVRVQEIDRSPLEATDLLVNRSHNLPIIPSTALIELKNTGNTAVYQQALLIYYDDELIDKFDVPVLLPYSAITTEVQIPFSLSSGDMPAQVKFEFGKETISLPTNKKNAIYLNITAVLVFLFTILLFLSIKARRLRK